MENKTDKRNMTYSESLTAKLYVYPKVIYNLVEK